MPAATSKPTSTATHRVILAGQANVGKSVLFGRLTGEYAWVSNYPGTTVEVARGRMPRGRREVIDTPGINSLAAESEDERVAVEILLREQDAVLVQVADARNLSRALSLASQLAMLGRPMVLALNMMDEAETAGLVLDIARLERAFGCEVVPLVAIEGRGVAQLRRAIEHARVPRTELAQEPGPAAGHGEKTGAPACGPAARGCPISSACGTSPALQLHAPGSATWARRERWLSGVLREAVRRNGNGRLPWSEQIDEWLRWFPAGLAVMLATAAVLYLAVGVGAGAVSDFLTDRVFGAWLSPALASVVARAGWPALTDFLTGQYGLFSTGLSYGLGLVLPVLTCFFFLFALLEDSGYLPRLAVLWHRAIERVGLSGKAVVPLVLGLGCGTMATVATRVLPTRRERILAALLIAVGIPCSAQLGVLLGLLAGVSVWAPLVIAGVVLLQLLWVGKVGAKLVPGTATDFVLELPPLRVPRPGNLLRKTLLRVAWYLREAIPIFLLGTVILFVLDRLGLVGGLIAAAQPVVTTWLGLPPETAVAFVMGFLRRDYGAAGLYVMAHNGQLDVTQVVVASTTLVLFMPCVANFLMLVKEFGARVAVRVALVATGVALLAGGILRAVMQLIG